MSLLTGARAPDLTWKGPKLSSNVSGLLEMSTEYICMIMMIICTYKYL